MFNTFFQVGRKFFTGARDLPASSLSYGPVNQLPITCGS